MTLSPSGDLPIPKQWPLNAALTVWGEADMCVVSVTINIYSVAF